MMPNKCTGALSNYICSNKLIEIGGECKTLRHGSFKQFDTEIDSLVFLIDKILNI